MLKRLFAIYKLELRLTCFHWSYLLFMLAWAGFIVTSYLNDGLYTVLSMLFAVQGFATLIALFLAGIQAGRAQRSRFDLLEVAFPTGIEVFLARWLASITASAGLLVAPLVVMVIIARYQYTLAFLPDMLFNTLLSISFVTGLIWIVQTTVGIRRWMYPLFVVIWIGSGALPNFVSTGGVPVPGITLLNFVMMERGYDSPLWGTLQQNHRPQLFTLFYVGLVALFAGVMAWRVIRLRFHHRSLPALGFTGAALALVLMTGGMYISNVSAATQSVLADSDRLQRGYERFTLTVPYAVTDYDITATLAAIPQFTAVVEVVNQSDTALDGLDFTLNHQFEITDISVPFERDENFLHLDLSLNPGESTSLTFNYQGELWVHDRVLGRAPLAQAFIDPAGVHLTCDSLWYPLAGRILPDYTPYVEGRDSKPHCILNQPAAFRVVVESDLTFDSNLTAQGGDNFSSEGARFVELIGAPSLTSVTHNDLIVVALPNKIDLIAENVENTYMPAYRHMKQFFPDVPPLKVVAIDMGSFSFGGWWRFPASKESLFMIVAPRAMDFVDPQNISDYFDIGYPVFGALFGESSVLADNIAFFLWIHHQTGGNLDQMRVLMQDGLPGVMMYGIQERFVITTALLDLYAAGGESAVRDLLQLMRANVDTLSALSASEIVTWIEAE